MKNIKKPISNYKLIFSNIHLRIKFSKTNHEVKTKIMLKFVEPINRGLSRMSNDFRFNVFILDRPE